MWDVAYQYLQCPEVKRKLISNATYFNIRMYYRSAHNFLGVRPAINYNLRKVERQNSQPFVEKKISSTVSTVKTLAK